MIESVAATGRPDLAEPRAEAPAAFPASAGHGQETARILGDELPGQRRGHPLGSD